MCRWTSGIKTSHIQRIWKTLRRDKWKETGDTVCASNISRLCAVEKILRGEYGEINRKAVQWREITTTCQRTFCESWSSSICACDLCGDPYHGPCHDLSHDLFHGLCHGLCQYLVLEPRHVCGWLVVVQAARFCVEAGVTRYPRLNGRRWELKNPKLMSGVLCPCQSDDWCSYFSVWSDHRFSWKNRGLGGRDDLRRAWMVGWSR